MSSSQVSLVSSVLLALLYPGLCFTDGLILFSIYTTPISNIIQNHYGIGFHFYTDTAQLYVHFAHKNVVIGILEVENLLR